MDPYKGSIFLERHKKKLVWFVIMSACVRAQQNAKIWMSVNNLHLTTVPSIKKTLLGIMQVPAIEVQINQMDFANVQLNHFFCDYILQLSIL